MPFLFHPRASRPTSASTGRPMTARPATCSRSALGWPSKQRAYRPDPQPQPCRPHLLTCMVERDSRQAKAVAASTRRTSKRSSGRDASAQAPGSRPNSGALPICHGGLSVDRTASERLHGTHAERRGEPSTTIITSAPSRLCRPDHSPAPGGLTRSCGNETWLRDTHPTPC